MPCIYVTGAAGSGKSTICNQLRKLGYDAYDEDEPKIGSAHNKQSGEPVSVPPADQRTPEWFTQHEWRILTKSKKELEERAKTSLIFLCGNSLSNKEIGKLFDKIIYLKIDNDSLRKRIAGRADNDYGKNKNELDSILARNHTLEQTYGSSNATIVDASQSIDNVGSDILKSVSSNAS